MQIDIDEEALDKVIVEQLIWHRDTFIEYLDPTEQVSIFSTNKEEDRKELKKHIKAFDKVISYFSQEAP